MYPELLNSTRCPQNALKWAANALNRPIVKIDTLVGSTSAAVYLLTCADKEQAVLRLFTLRDWLAMEPDLALHEAGVLQQVATCPVPTPRLIAFDETGRKTTHPAVLMSKVTGSVELNPANFDSWLEQMAVALAAIHRTKMQVKTAEFGWHHRFWYDRQKELTVPEWSRQPAAFGALIDLLKRPPPPMPDVFIHRDYHPTNVLWQDGKLSGVVDWVNGCVGPAMVDVAHCRLNLASLFGPQAAERFLQVWLDHAGAENYSLWWDANGLAEGWVFTQKLAVYGGWSAFGKTDVTVEQIAERLDQFAVELASRL